MTLPVGKHEYKKNEPGKVRITATFKGDQAHMVTLIAEFLEKLDGFVERFGVDKFRKRIDGKFTDEFDTDEFYKMLKEFEEVF